MRKLCLLLLLSMVAAGMDAKKIKVSVVPSTAKIYVDGSYYGDGVVTINVKDKDGFVALKIEEAGYATIETRVFSTDTRKAIAYTMRVDPVYENTSENGNANKYFTVNVSKDLYSKDANGKTNTELAWKIVHSVILNYFDEIQTSNLASGFVQTAWKIKKFPEVQRAIRTRVSVKETNLGGDLAFSIRIQSEVASMRGRHNDEAYQKTDRILKEVEPIINEFQTQLGKQ